MQHRICLIARELTLMTGALVLAVFVSRFVPRLPRPAPEPAGVPSNSVMVPNPARLPPEYERALFVRALSEGDAVLIGSSEMTYNGETAAHRLFNEACGKRILTVGRAGYQTLPILLTLADVKHALSGRSDVTVILSPGWLAEFGTQSGAFLKYLKPDALRTLFARDDLHPLVRDGVAREIRVHRDEFSGLYPDWLFPWVPGLAKLMPVVDFEPFDAPAPTNHPRKSHYDWEANERKQREIAISEAAGNPVGTSIEHYRKHQHEFPLKVKPVDRYDVERRDMLALSTFLKDHGVHARFIVQPLHRRVYRDLSAYDERMAGVLAQMKNDGHEVYDMATEHFDPYLMSDAMHFNGYGWLKTQREMCGR